MRIGARGAFAFFAMNDRGMGDFRAGNVVNVKPSNLVQEVPQWVTATETYKRALRDGKIRELADDEQLPLDFYVEGVPLSKEFLDLMHKRQEEGKRDVPHFLACAAIPNARRR